MHSLFERMLIPHCLSKRERQLVHLYHSIQDLGRQSTMRHKTYFLPSLEVFGGGGL